MDFGFIACRRARGLRATLSIRPQLRPAAPAAGQNREDRWRRPWCALCWRTNAANRVAATAVRGLALRLSKGQATSAGLSLARTAALLIGTPRQRIEPKALSPDRRGLFGRHRSHRLGIGASRAAACLGRGRADGLDASGLTPGLGASGVGSLSGAPLARSGPNKPALLHLPGAVPPLRRPEVRIPSAPPGSRRELPRVRDAHSPSII